jgi:hypothetical protein
MAVRAISIRGFVRDSKRSTARDEGMLIMTRRFRKFNRERRLVLVAFLVLLFLGFYFGVFRVAPPLHSAG